jgi:LPS sulfotransferase NodH
MSTPATIPLPKARTSRKAGRSDWRLTVAKLRNQLKLLRHWWLRPHTPYLTLFVLATHRSGSNLLVDYLNRAGGISCHSEVLCPTLAFGPLSRRTSPEAALAHIRRSLQTFSKPIRGCKIMLDQLERCGLAVDDLSEAFADARFVVLYRQSLAEQFVSLKSAALTNQWVLLPGQESRSVQIRIDRGELRAYCEQIKSYYTTLLRAPGLAEKAVLLSYEELIAEPEYWLGERICPLAGASPTSIQTEMRKQNTRSLADQIENYREVEALLLSPHCRQSYAWPGERRKWGRAA